MKHFTGIADVNNPSKLVEEALTLKKNPHQFEHLGKHLCLVLFFFNPSLRTRLSTEKAGANLGMQVITMNAQQGWKIEFQDGAVMNADRAEHIREAAGVISQYAHIIGLRTFPGLTDRELDYADQVLHQFMKHATVPVISLESAIRHPLQSLADWMTIEEHKPIKRPKVVLTWAPHPKALPQAVPNSFVEWMKHAGVDLHITHPEGYALAPEFTAGLPATTDQEEALRGAHFVYAKNWSSYEDYGQVLPVSENWTVTAEKMALTDKGFFMHCLPVRRNVVVEGAVLDSSRSLVLQQANNRTYAAQAVLRRMILNLKDDSGQYRFAQRHLFE